MNDKTCDCPEPIELFTGSVRLHKPTCEYCVDKDFDALIVDGVVMPIYVEPIRELRIRKPV